jgi:hypothetical protein
MIQKRTNYLWLTFFLISCILGACTPAPQTTVNAPGMKGREKLLVLHFRDMAALHGENKSFICPLCNSSFTTGSVSAGSADRLTDHLFSMLKIHTDFRVIPQGQAHGAMAGVLSESATELPELKLLEKTGLALGADVVLVGHLYRFKERVGTAYSVDSPASVSYDLDLIGVADGRLLWSSHFDETQRSLFENLYELGAFFKRRGQWVTAEELAVSGLETIIEKMPKP